MDEAISQGESKNVIRVLFVDDEPLVLRALGRMAHGMREECDAAFASSGEEALTLMAGRPFDVLVSDMRMPGMDGAAVLTQAERRFPWIARIILSGYTQYESALRALPVCHRFLSKPLRAEDLRLVLLRTIALHRLLSDPTLRELVGEAKELPARPQVYFQLRGALANPSASMRAIARIVERDSGITGRLLRTVNNAFFAPASRITSAQQAISHLGTELMTGLVLSLECFGNFEDMLAQCELIPESLERKAYLTATITAELLADETQRQDAFLAALLHDCGLLLLAARRPAMVSEAVRVARQDATPLHVAERKLWGTTHAQIGAYLLGLWGLPYPVVEAVASCHAPEKNEGPEFDVGSAVYMAAALAEAAMAGDTAAVELDADFVQRMGLAGRMPEFIGLVERIIGQSEDATSAGADIH
jgi:HD-like signal output (HDOD) protein/ActR/RegA family two-component response regulator